MGALGLFELIHDLVKFKRNLHGLGLIFPSEQFQIKPEVIDHFTESRILIQKLWIVFEYNFEFGFELSIEMVFGIVGFALFIEPWRVDEGTALTDGFELGSRDTVLLMGVIWAIGWLTASWAWHFIYKLY